MNDQTNSTQEVKTNMDDIEKTQSIAEIDEAIGTETKALSEEEIAKKEEEVKQAQALLQRRLGITPEGRKIGKPQYKLESIQNVNGTLVPTFRYDWEYVESKQKYPPAKLRELRAERGVGSAKKRQKALREKALNELTAQAQELNMGY